MLPNGKQAVGIALVALGTYMAFKYLMSMPQVSEKAPAWLK